MPFEYLVIIVVLVGLGFVAYMGWERMSNGRKRPDSSLYVESLRDLLDGYKEKAFGKLRQVVAEDSNNIDAYLRLGQILREHNRADRALQVHKDLTLRIGLSNEQKSQILWQLAEDYQVLDDTATAVEALTELTELQPNNHAAFSRLLALQKKSRKWEDAYDTAVKLLKIESNKSKKPLAPLKYQQGKALYEKREYHKARVVFKEAIGLDPQYVPAYLSIGDSYCEEQRFEDAVNFWVKLITANPEQGHQVIERLARTLFDLGRYGEIVDICQNILAHAPRNVEARLTLSRFYRRKGDLDAAKSFLVDLVDESPDQIVAVIELIRIYLELGEHQKIDEVCRRVGKRQVTTPPSGKDQVADASLMGIQ